MSTLDDSDLLRKFTFHLRTPLYGIKGALQLATLMSENAPMSLRNWLEKWKPSVERWISAEEKTHLLLHDGETHNWKQLIYEMAEDMKDVSIAFTEGQKLEIPESPEGKMIIKMAVGNFEYLNKIVQPILGRDYHHLQI
jgi:hypothetical protein